LTQLLQLLTLIATFGVETLCRVSAIALQLWLTSHQHGWYSEKPSFSPLLLQAHLHALAQLQEDLPHGRLRERQSACCCRLEEAGQVSCWGKLHHNAQLVACNTAQHSTAQGSMMSRQATVKSSQTN